MPLKKGGGKKAVGRNIKELHQGPRYKANVDRFGYAKANQIAVAVAEKASRERQQGTR